MCETSPYSLAALEERAQAAGEVRRVTLVLQGAKPLLGLCVQLFQVRWSTTGEEDIVLVLIHNKPWSWARSCTLAFVTFSFGRA